MQLQGGCGKEMTLYVCLGGFFKQGVGGKLCYKAGRKDCVWVKKIMGVLDVLRFVEEVCVYAYIYMAGSEGPYVRQLYGNEAYKRWEEGGGCSDGGRGGESVNVAHAT